MTYAGARGNTEKQMMQALHFGKNEKSFHEGFGALQARINDVQKKGDVKLSVANRLMDAEGLQVLARVSGYDKPEL